MRLLIRFLLLLLAVISATVMAASSLTVSAKHDVVVTDDDKKQVLRVLFADDQLLADIKLNVYVLDELPSTRAHQDELRKLTDQTWLDAVAWSLVTVEGAEVALPAPAVLSKVTRQRGPAAARPGDRDTTVPMTTYRARLAFGAIPSGDYILKATIRGLESKTSALSFELEMSQVCKITTSASRRCGPVTMRSFAACSWSDLNVILRASTPHETQEFRDIKRLAQGRADILSCNGMHRLLGCRRDDDHHLLARPARLQRIEHIKPTPWPHHEVEDDEVVALGVNLPERFLPVRRFVNVVVVLSQDGT